MKSKQQTTENILEIRPFHLYTLLLFLNPGSGLFYRTERTYGEEWTKTVNGTISRAKNLPNLGIKLVRDTDFMCEICQYRSLTLSCKADLHNFDARFIEKYSLSYGKVYSIEDIEKMNILNREFGAP